MADIELLEGEEWRPVVGYEGQYEVSNMGRVRSLERKVLGKDGRWEIHHGKILKPWKTNVGNDPNNRYLIVSMPDHNRRMVHSLVAEAFIGERPEKHDVMHLNGIRHDNRVENLKYGTRSENLKQTYEYGGKPANAKLCPADVHVIRRRLKTGESCIKIAEDYGVSSAAIYHIRNKTAYAWVREEDENVAT